MVEVISVSGAVTFTLWEALRSIIAVLADVEQSWNTPDATRTAPNPVQQAAGCVPPLTGTLLICSTSRKELTITGQQQ